MISANTPAAVTLAPAHILVSSLDILYTVRCKQNMLLLPSNHRTDVCCPLPARDTPFYRWFRKSANVCSPPVSGDVIQIQHPATGLSSRTLPKVLRRSHSARKDVFHICLFNLYPASRARDNQLAGLRLFHSGRYADRVPE